MTDIYQKTMLREKLESKIMVLNVATWEDRIGGDLVSEWIDQFDEATDIQNDEQIHALFLLSNFMYFGQSELRSLLKSLYRDMIRTPILHEIRRDNLDTTKIDQINEEYQIRCRKMRFLAVGNPSESGMHLLYYFRQENMLPKDMFINTHEIFDLEVIENAVQTNIRNPEIDRYIFIDDFCGSGTQAKDYLLNIVKPLKMLSTAVKVSYLVLFATSQGLRAIRNFNCFDTVDTVFELDETFRVLEENSRLFDGEEETFDRTEIRKTCQKYGEILSPKHPLGYKNGQMLIGFNHNTPNNTLPIFWGGNQNMTGPWKALFLRYDKVNGV